MTVIGQYNGVNINSGTQAQVDAQVAAINAQASAPQTNTSSVNTGNVADMLNNAQNITQEIQSELNAGTISPTTATSELNQVQSGVNTLNNLLTQTNTSSSTSATGSSSGSGTSTTDTTIPSTGDTQLDSIQASLQSLLASNKAVIPPGLQITPALTAQFLTWAQDVVDPQTQQLINQHITAINSNLVQQNVDYQNAQGQTIQNFGDQLASTQNAAGGAGVAMSGLTNLGEQNLAASANRTLGSEAADTENAIGQELNAGAAQVGSANAGSFNIPSLTGYGVSASGGSRGSSLTGGNLSYNYNPSAYTMGTDISTGAQNVANQQANYLSQYGTLAGNNSNQTIASLIGGITGLPAGYTVPAGLT